MSQPAPLKAFWRYCRNWLVALDQLVNATLGGDAQETLSYRAAVGCSDGASGWCLLCRVLGWIIPDHCTEVLRANNTRALPGSPAGGTATSPAGAPYLGCGETGLVEASSE